MPTAGGEGTAFARGKGQKAAQTVLNSTFHKAKVGQALKKILICMHVMYTSLRVASIIIYLEFSTCPKFCDLEAEVKQRAPAGDQHVLLGTVRNSSNRHLNILEQINRDMSIDVFLCICQISGLKRHISFD